MNPLIQSPVTTPVDRSASPNRIPQIKPPTPLAMGSSSMPGGYK